MSLPSNWAVTRLGECQGKPTGLDPRAFPSETFDLFSVPSYSAYQPDRVAGEEIGSAKQVVQPGDVLLCKIVPHIRRGWSVPEAGEHRQIASGEWIVLRDHGLDPEYLRRLVLSDVFHEQFMRTVSGVGGSLMRARPADAAKIKVPVPPLAEQRRIVAKLDALTSRLVRARAELDRPPVLADRLRERTLSDAYVVAGNGASFEPISFFIASLDQGWSPKCENYPSVSPEEWAVLKTTAVQALRFRDYENKVLPLTMQPRERLEVAAGDVLVTRAGPRVRVGISCAVAETRPRLILADKIYRLRCNPSRSIPDYLALMLNSPQVLERIEAMKTGISDSGLNLTQEKFLSLPIPKLNVDQQQDLVGKLSGQFASADRLEAEAARARALLDRLEAAILAKAFRGELVPQDPDDEPASVLLERIRAQRAAAPKAKRGRRAKVGADA